MSFVEVFITTNVYYSCMTHALSTEREEIMGLLLGDTEWYAAECCRAGGPAVKRVCVGGAAAAPAADGAAAAAGAVEVGLRLGLRRRGAGADRVGVGAGAGPERARGSLRRLPNGKGFRTVVWALVLLPRSEKKTDRVEIDPEMLANATDRAEELTKQMGRTTRVIGVCPGGGGGGAAVPHAGGADGLAQGVWGGSPSLLDNSAVGHALRRGLRAHARCPLFYAARDGPGSPPPPSPFSRPPARRQNGGQPCSRPRSGAHNNITARLGGFGRGVDASVGVSRFVVPCGGWSTGCQTPTYV